MNRFPPFFHCQRNIPPRSCIKLWDYFDACGELVYFGGATAATQAERNVIIEGWRCIATAATSRNESETQIKTHRVAYLMLS